MNDAGSSGPTAWRRLALTAALSLLPVLGSFVPMPGVNWDSRSGDSQRILHTSLFEPCVGALLSGYLVVELVALLVPRLRELRHGFPAGRARLRTAAHLTALFFAAFQAFGLSTVFKELAQNYGGGDISTPLMIVSVTAATGVLVLVARAIDGLGLVNGVVAVSLASEFAKAPSHFARAAVSVDTTAISIAIALYVLPVAATWAALRRFQRPAHHDAPWLGGPLSSLRPVLAAASVLTVPSALRSLRVPGADAWAAWISGPYYLALLLGTGLTITLVLSVLLQLPERVTRVLNVLQQRETPFTTTEAQRAWRRELLPTVLLILTVLLASALQNRHQLPDYAFALALLTALLMDGAHALALHRAEPNLACVWEERRPYAVPGLVAAAERAGISLRVSGTAQTGMLRLFGPYAAISLWCTSAQAVAARELFSELLPRASSPRAVATPSAATATAGPAPSANYSAKNRIYTAVQAGGFLLVVAIAILWPAPRALPPRSTESAPTTGADVELLLVDDTVDPLASQVEPQLPTGVALLKEELRFISGTRHYARLVLQRDESFERARVRLQPWLATLPLPPDKRLGWQKQATGQYRSYVLSGSPVFSGSDLQSAQVTRGANDLSAVGVRLYSGAAEVFRRFTRDHQGQRMALVINHVIVMAPLITSEISGGTVQITTGGGDPDSSRESAEALVKQLTTPSGT